MENQTAEMFACRNLSVFEGDCIWPLVVDRHWLVRAEEARLRRDFALIQEMKFDKRLLLPVNLKRALSRMPKRENAERELTVPQMIEGLLNLQVNTTW